jgi:Fe-S oxidoreductase
MINIDDSRWEHVNELTDNFANICYQCGVCTARCPVGAVSDDLLNVRKLVRSAQIGIDYTDNLWSCATCKLCETTCPRDVKIVNVLLGLRKLAFEEHKAPEKIEKVVWDIYENGNPWGGKKSERAKWAEGMQIKDAKKGVDVLLYVGCEAAYDKRIHSVTKAIAEILKAKNIDFGILGNEELCCGEPLRNAGEWDYMEELATKNINDFKNTNAKVIVTVSPHCSNTFKEVYTKFGLDVKVMHYAEYFYQLYRDGVIDFKKSKELKVTYHDPCILSRTDHFNEGPREMLQNIQGLELKEMKNAKEESICCGGGGNRMFLEFHGKRLADVRTDEAKQTGAEMLITACPYCNMNLHDSSKTRSLNIEVKDLAEILRDVIL